MQHTDFLGAELIDSDGNGNLEIIFQDGYYMLPLTGTALDDPQPTSTPLFKVFAQATDDEEQGQTLLGFTDILRQVALRYGNRIDSENAPGLLTFSQVERFRNVYGYEDSEQNTPLTGVTGFTENPNNFYREVTVGSFVDTQGNIVLTSQYPFSGYAQIFISGEQTN